MTLVEFDQARNVEIGQAIAVCQHECIAVDIFLDPLHAPTRHGRLTGFRERNLEPLLGVQIVELNLRFPPQADGEVIVHRLVVQKIFFDHVAAISQAQDKLAVAAVGEQLHDVPEDGAAANFNHRFWPELGFLTQTRTESTA